MSNPYTFYPSSNVVYDVIGNSTYMGGSPSSSVVNMFVTDDGSGRQKWWLLPAYPNLLSTVPVFYNIVVEGGGTSGTYLSCSSDGKTISLASKDDGSGRQRWVLSPSVAGGNLFCIQVYGGVTMAGAAAPYFLVTSGSNIVLQSGNNGAQIWSFANCPRYF